MSIISARFGFAAVVLMLLSGCASPTATQKPTGPEPTSSSTPDRELGVAEPGQSRIPIDCADIAPETAVAHAMGAAEENLTGASRVIGMNAGLLECLYPAGAADISLFVVVLAGEPSAWREHLLAEGGTDVAGIVEKRYCWGELADANHCGVRLALGDYAAELFLNSSTTPGAVSRAIDGASAEVRSVLSALQAPLSPSAEITGRLLMPVGCEAVSLSGTPAGDEVSWTASPANGVGSGDGPALYYAAVQRAGALRCAWWEPTVGTDIGFDWFEFQILPNSAWAFSSLATGDSAVVSGVDEARVSVSTDPYEPSAHAAARVGPDVVLLSVQDHEANGFIDDDQAGLAIRMLSALIDSLTL